MKQVNFKKIILLLILAIGSSLLLELSIARATIATTTLSDDSSATTSTQATATVASSTITTSNTSENLVPASQTASSSPTSTMTEDLTTMIITTSSFTSTTGTMPMDSNLTNATTTTSTIVSTTAIIDDISTASTTATTTLIQSTTPTSTATGTQSTASNGSVTNSNYSANSNEKQNTVSDAQIQQAVEKIINYIKSQQVNDGKIFDAGVSDWLIMSFVAAGHDPAQIKSGDKSLLDYALNYVISQTNELNECAAYPRHLLALYTAGIPKTDRIIQDLLNKVKTQCYEQGDFGQNGINDDIFGLISLLAMNEDIAQPIISDLVTNIVADQQDDGSFTWAGWPGADITGGAINALKYANNKGININQDIFSRAKNYLKSSQLSDGGWTGYGLASDALTTGWVIMGINAIGEKQSDWIKNNSSPWHILTNQLTEQGYYESSWQAGAIDWFALKHAVPALLGHGWPIEPKFSQSSQIDDTELVKDSTGGGFVNNSSTSKINTSTADANTSLATSTIDQSTTDMVMITSTTTTSTASENQLSTAVISLVSSTESITEPPIIQPIKVQSTTINPPEEKITSANPTLVHITNSPLVNSSTLQPSDQNQMVELEPIIDKQLPDTPSRQAAKQTLVISSSGAMALGLYIGLKLLKNLL